MNAVSQRHNDYDEFAQAYAHNNESNAFNALYERPAILSLIGDVTFKASGCSMPGAVPVSTQQN